MIAIAGGILAALGLLAAALLVAAPLGLLAAVPGLSLWILFPLLTLVGYVLLVVGDPRPAGRGPTQMVAIPLLVLALLAAIGLVAIGAGLANAGGAVSALPLWYVLVLGGVLGIVGSAASSRRSPSAQAG
jgi:hypothetical protein